MNPLDPRELVRLLDGRYGRKEWGRSDSPLTEFGPDPLDTLIATILSQATSDGNCRRAFSSLKEAYPSWEEVLRAPEEDIARAIRAGGLADQKAPRIKEILGRLAALTGKPSLDFLGRMTMEEAREFLLGLPGVGPKTADCVLLFCYRHPAFPADTHIRRIAARLGLDTRRVLLPPVDLYSLHVNLIEHGRKVCRPKKPYCGECVLSRHCDRHGL